MRIDPRLLRVWAAGVVFGAGASFLFSGSERAQYVFMISLIAWVVLVLIGRLTKQSISK